MNQQERTELERLKQEQSRLERELSLLGSQLNRLEQRLRQPVSQPAIPSAPTPSEGLAKAERSPALLRVAVIPQRPGSEIKQTPPPAEPPPVPPVLTQKTAVPEAVAASVRCSAERQPRVEEGAPAAAAEAAQPAGASTPPAAATTKGSLEMRLGTYWAPRIGMVVVLTGLALFANLAYQRLGPAGKVGLLYLASGLLLGAGWWWQRKAAETSLKNYAQVLFAGGWAALYFTTYAAHHMPSLKVIDSALVDGVLLLGCAGFMVWFADRRKSEVLAIFAVGLAYYTSVITHVGAFTLYSNLVLTVAAVFFLVRHRWLALTWGSILASYGAYAFWRFYDGRGWHWASPEEGLWGGTYFLICYWAVFTAGVFLSRAPKFAGQNRASFLTLNNGAFFTMFLLTMLQVQQGGFWKFALVYGSGLLAMSRVARRLLADEPLAAQTYLTQGLLLATVGIISNPRLAGLQLALVLAAESVLLLLLGQQRKNWILLIGAYLTAGLAVGWGIDGMRLKEPAGVWLAIGLGLLMLANAVLAHRGAATGKDLLRPQPAYFTILMLAVCFVATWNNAPREDFPWVAALEAGLLLLSIYLLRVPEVSLLSQGYLALAEVIWAYGVFDRTPPTPWWNMLLMPALVLGLNEWCQRQRILGSRAQNAPGLDAFAGVSLWGSNLVLLTAAYVGIRLGAGWGDAWPDWPGACGTWLPVAVCGLTLGETWLAHRRQPVAARALRWQPAYATALALSIGLALAWNHTTRAQFPLVLAAAGLLLTWSYYGLRIPEVSLLGQAYVVLAQLAWVVGTFSPPPLPPWWNPVLVLGITLALGHWWQHQQSLVLPTEVGKFWQLLYALAVAGILYFWLHGQVSPPAWLLVSSLLAVGLTAYGVATRAWLVAACGQLFVLAGGLAFCAQLAEGRPAWGYPLMPVAVTLLLSGGTVAWFERRPGSDGRIQAALLGVARLYRWVALVMSLAWIWNYIPIGERIWVTGGIGAAVFVLAGWRRSREALLYGAIYMAMSLALFWLPVPELPREMKVHWPNLLAFLLLLGQQQAVRRLPERYAVEARVQGAVILAGGLSLWLFLTRWVQLSASGFYLTASWSLLALALFACGITLRERLYRWLGLGILACALGRVVIFDLLKLETLYRILSFLALGIVLLVLGFVYNKYQEKIKEWL